MSRSRAFCFTWNNYPADAIETLRSLDSVYILATYEVAPATGTPHLQGYVYFRNGKTLSAVTRLMPRCHITVARGSAQQNYEYCTKTRAEDIAAGTVASVIGLELGTKPMDNETKGRKGKEFWDDVVLKAKAGRLEEIDSNIYVTQYNTLKRIAVDHMEKPPRLETSDHLWIYGATGCGKSTAVHDKYPDLYLKDLTQWWDGYRGEDIVLVDDMDPYHRGLARHFKLWGDKLPFHCQSKGSANTIRPKRVIVTSQYTPEQVWDDEETLAAIQRRFRLVHKVSLASEVEWN